MMVRQVLHVCMLSLLGVGLAVAQGQETSAPAGPYVLSDSIIGTDIETQDGEAMTSIEQLIIARDSGRIRYAVADVGGFLGMGAREVAIPWHRLEMMGHEQVMFSGTEDELRNAPEFTEDEFLGMENLAEWEQRTKDVFGAGDTDTAGINETGESVGRLDRALVLSDHLVGTDIEDGRDESLGQIDQLIIERSSGTAKFVVTDVGGFLGVGAREVAVPWTSLRFTGEEEVVLSRIENLENAPRFDEDAFLAMTDPSDWERDVEQFFRSN